MAKSIHQHLVVIILVGLIIITGCGKKGPLVLSPEISLLAVTDFSLQQIGASIHLAWKFPMHLSDQKSELDMAAIKSIYIYYSTKMNSADNFKKKSTLIKKIKFQELSKKDRLAGYNIKLNTDQINQKNHSFAVIYHFKGKKSPLSEIVSIETKIVAQPINDLRLTQEGKLIKLQWSQPKLNINKKATTISGYKIYRKIESENTHNDFEVLNRFDTQGSLALYYNDSDTGSNGTYGYYVASTSNQNCESEPSNLVMIKISDIYPPDTPGNLISFKQANEIYLTWEKVEDKDLAYYRIYRRLANEQESKLLADKVETNYYTDKKIEKGKRYYYYVTAVDIKHNESDPSPEVREEIQ